MKTIAGYDMCKHFVNNKSLAITHRFQTYDEQLDIFKKLNKPHKYFGVSVGIKKEDYEFVEKAYDNGVRIVCVDIAHGDSQHCLDICKFIKKYNDVLLIAGNVAHGEAAKRLWAAGADVVKSGIGAGAVCLTRGNTACGIPMMSTLFSSWDARNDTVFDNNLKKLSLDGRYIIADGGISKPGHCGLALSRSHMVMVGSYLAGTDECPGAIIEEKGVKYKRYEGSSTYKKENVEGVKALVKYKGAVSNIIKSLTDGIRSTCSYVDASNLDELKENATYMQISNAGYIESGTHSVDKVV
jgi:IMP dehydrogenase/GMP reductase